MRALAIRRGLLWSCALFLWVTGANAPLAFHQAGTARTVLVPVVFLAGWNGVPVLDLKPQDLALRVDIV